MDLNFSKKKKHYKKKGSWSQNRKRQRNPSGGDGRDKDGHYELKKYQMGSA